MELGEAESICRLEGGWQLCWGGFEPTRNVGACGYVHMPSQKGTTTNVCTLPAKSLRPRPILACKNASEVQQGTLSTQPAIAIIIKCRNVHVQWNLLEHRRQLSLAQQVHVAYNDFLNLFSTPC